MVAIASSSSFTFIVPSSAANADPDRPASTKAARRGPISRTTARPMTEAVKISAPKWASGWAPSIATLTPNRALTSDTTGSAFTPAFSNTRAISRQRMRRGRRMA